jgi:hypothetical protein
MGASAIANAGECVMRHAPESHKSPAQGMAAAIPPCSIWHRSRKMPINAEGARRVIAAF